MLRAKNIWVMGGDPRQAALAALLADDGHSVHTYALEQGAGMKCEPSTAGADRADCVILPLPAAGPDGGLNTPLSERRHHLEEVLDGLRPGQLVCAGMVDGRLKELAEARGLTLRDYFAREELAVLNAVPTAEGALQIALEELPITLHDARVLVIGFGRLGKAWPPACGPWVPTCGCPPGGMSSGPPPRAWAWAARGWTASPTGCAATTWCLTPCPPRCWGWRSWRR